MKNETMKTGKTKDGVDTCIDYLKQIQELTGIRPRVSMMSTPNRTNGTVDTYATADKSPELVLKVMTAEGERIETQRLDGLKVRRPESWRRLRDYFTVARLNTNPLVRAEKEVLIANGYNMETDYYMAFGIPFGKGLMISAFFLFATSTEKAKLDKYLPEIRKIID